MLVDLHTHTTASDGKLTPAELIEQARAAGIGMLAITDHDAIDAYAALANCALDGLRLVTGIEFSSRWQRAGIHVVGLNFALDSPALLEALAHQGGARHERAQRIAERLHKRGIPDALAGAARCAGNNSIGRPHFAEYLVSIGVAATVEQAFKRFLGTERSGATNEYWAALPAIIDWIRGAGGTPVLAHPAKYGLTRNKLDTLVHDFRAAGGAALEIVSGQQRPELTRDLAALAERHGLQAALGSDFHRPGQSWAQLGKLAPLPALCTPVWDEWQ